jgi:hypothetical protein
MGRNTRLRNEASQNQTPKFLEARNSLPEELRSVYDRMIAEYRFQALKLYGRDWVAYKVIAELVREGWRPG